MSGKAHESLVADQFGPRAAAYVLSAVHAQGDDLLRLAEMVRGHRDARALDMGSGGGHVSFSAAPHVGEIVAYDLSEAMLRTVAAEAARRGLPNLRACRGTVARLAFADDTFDFVFSRYSAHHWRDLAGALGEARRVLRPGGAGAFIDLVAPEDPLHDTFLQAVELLRDPSHVRDYTRSEWEAALGGAGFTVKTVTMRRLRLDFASWIARIGASDLAARAILALQRAMSRDVVDHFAIEGDGSFTIDVATFEVAGS